MLLGQLTVVITITSTPLQPLSCTRHHCGVHRHEPHWQDQGGIYPPPAHSYHRTTYIWHHFPPPARNQHKQCNFLLRQWKWHAWNATSVHIGNEVLHTFRRSFLRYPGTSRWLHKNYRNRHNCWANCWCKRHTCGETWRIPHVGVYQQSIYCPNCAIGGQDFTETPRT